MMKISFEPLRQGATQNERKVIVRLNLDNVQSNAEQFNMYVYSSGLWLMATACSSDEEFTVTRQGELRVPLQSEFEWLPGQYMLIMRCDKGCPDRYDFTIDASLHVSRVVRKACRQMGMEDILSSAAINGHRLSWWSLYTQGGALNLKRRVVELTRLAALNKWRDEHNMFPIERDAHFLFVAPTKAYLRRMGLGFNAMIGNGVKHKAIDCSTLYDSTNANPYEPLNELLSGGTVEPKSLFDFSGDTDKNVQSIFFWNISMLAGQGGKLVVRRILDHVRDGRLNIQLCGTAQEVDQVLQLYPSLKQLFPSENRIELTEYSLEDIVQCFLIQTRFLHLPLSFEARQLMVARFTQAHAEGRLMGWDSDTLRSFLQEHVKPHYIQRQLRQGGKGPVEVLPEDIDASSLSCGQSTYEEAIAELNGMIGLDDIKHSITTASNRMKFNLERRRLGLRTSDDAPFHALFTGAPGTGKTTVARLLGRIYHSLGLLSRGEVICVDRTRLIGRYIGETEENMKVLLDEARGNVLFVDEAYTLYSNQNSNDFGRHVIDCLMTVLTQKHPDMLIVFAGYEKEMDRLMSMNPGLVGRFPYKYRFTDYSPEELMQIALRLLQRDEYVLTDEAGRLLQRAIADTVAQKTPNFGNARWVEQYIENGIIPALADRLVQQAPPVTRELYQLIEVQDVEAAYVKFNPKMIELKPRRAVGFGA